jgi:O-antigen ligase
MNITSITLLLSLPLGFLNFGIFNALFAIVIAVLLTIKLGQKARASALHYLLVLFLYTVFCMLSIYHIFGDNFRHVWLLRYFLILHILILMSIATVNVYSANRFDLTVSMFILFMYIISDIFQIFTNSGLYLNSTHRYYGFTAERIVLSNFVAIFIILMMKFGGFSQKYYWQTFFVYLMCLTHIILTGSRSFLVLAILMFIFQNTKLRLKSLLYLIPFLGIVVMSLFFMFPRFRNLLNFETGSGLSRLNFINQGVEMFRDAPIFGVGYGKSIDKLTQSMPWEQSPAMHQDLLQIFAEGGITLGLLYLLLIFKVGVGRNLMLLLSIVILSTQNLMYYTFFCLMFFAYLRNYRLRQHDIT